jgi:hypothetical protein
MKITKNLLQVGVLGLSIMASSVMAAVSADEAAKLGTTLTPMGAEMAGNAAGTIPKWSPLPTNAGAVDARGFLANPYGSEQPQFIITAQNVEQYKDKLAPGQYAMFKRYPDTFRSTRPIAALPCRLMCLRPSRKTPPTPTWCPAATAWKTSKPPYRSRFRKAAWKSSGTTSPAIAAAA